MKSTTLLALVKTLTKLIKFALVLAIVGKTLDKYQEVKEEVVKKSNERG